jgi:hypothetical protein
LVGKGIPADCVDREIAAPGGVFERHRRIALDSESLVAAAGLGFAARQRDIDRPELIDRKRGSNRVDAPQRPQQR